MGRNEQASLLLESLAELIHDHPMTFWDHRGQVLSHFLAVGKRPADVCIDGIRRAMASYGTDRSYVCYSHFYCFIARAHLSIGDVDSGLKVIQEAFTGLETNDERDYLAEIHRIRGELLAAGGRPAKDVESAFSEALAVARSQGTKSLELRAALSLGKYRLSQGAQQKAKARALVQSVYDGFTEGFDSPDLVAARAFLEG